MMVEGSVAEVMQTEVFTLEADDTLDLLEGLMERNRIRHVPVVREGVLAGIVSQRDLQACALSAALDYEAEPREAFLQTLRVSQAMTSDVVSIGRNATLAGAAELMERYRIGCLPVVDSKRRLEGIVSQSDLLRAAYTDPEIASVRVESETSHSKWKALMQKERDELMAIREELAVQAQLGKAELRDRWEQLEKRFRGVSRRLDVLQDQSSAEAHSLGERLLRRTREEYRRFGELLAVT